MIDRRSKPEADSRECSGSGLVPLAMVDAGREAVLCRVEGGHGLMLRLAEMGIRPGARFTVLSRGRPGPFIVTVGQGRLAVGRGMVDRMFVRVV